MLLSRVSISTLSDAAKVALSGGLLGLGTLPTEAVAMGDAAVVCDANGSNASPDCCGLSESTWVRDGLSIACHSSGT